MNNIQRYDHTKLLADSMRRAREYHKLTQESLAAKSNLSNKTIQNLEEEHTDPRLGTVATVCNALDIDPREFICPNKLGDKPHIAQLHQVISDCTIQEAALLIPFISDLKELIRHVHSA